MARRNRKRRARPAPAPRDDLKRHHAKPGAASPAPYRPVHDASRPAGELERGQRASEAKPFDDFEALLARCPTPWRETVAAPPLRSPQEVAAYRRRLEAHAAAFGPSVPVRAWGPLRDLAIAEVETDRYAGAQAGILQQSRARSLVALLVGEIDTGQRATTASREEIALLVRAWLAGEAKALVQVEVALARAGLTPDAVEDYAHVLALPMVTAVGRLLANARLVTVRMRRLLDTIMAAERATTPARRPAHAARPGKRDDDRGSGDPFRNDPAGNGATDAGVDAVVDSDRSEAAGGPAETMSSTPAANVTAPIQADALSPARPDAPVVPGTPPATGRGADDPPSRKPFTPATGSGP
jgi:hypothetical protein